MFDSNETYNVGCVEFVCVELTQEVSRLQAELNKIKLQEFEAQEQTVDLTSELEEERRGRQRAEQELKVITTTIICYIISLNCTVFCCLSLHFSIKFKIIQLKTFTYYYIRKKIVNNKIINNQWPMASVFIRSIQKIYTGRFTKHAHCSPPFFFNNETNHHLIFGIVKYIQRSYFQFLEIICTT